MFLPSSAGRCTASSSGRTSPRAARANLAAYPNVRVTVGGFELVDLMGHEQRRETPRVTAAVVDEQLGGEVTKQYVAGARSVRRITRV